MATNKELYTLRTPPRLGLELRVQFSPDNRWIALEIQSGVALYKVTTGKLSRVVSKRCASASERHRGWPRIILFSLDSRYLVLEICGQMEIWNVETGQKQREFRQPDPSGIPKKYVAISPDGRCLAINDGDWVVLWDTATGEKLRTLAPGLGYGRLARAFAFSPNSRWIAVGLRRKIVTWDIPTGEERHTLTPTDNIFTHIHNIEFSPDSQLMVSAHWTQNESGFYIIWDLDSCNKLHTVQLPESQGCRFAISPDSQHVVFLLRRGLQFWERATGREIWSDMDVPYYGLIWFTPCGRYVATDRGAFQLPSPAPQPSPYLSTTKTWIQKDGNDLLYIHPDYQNEVKFVVGNCVFFENALDSILQIDTSSAFNID